MKPITTVLVITIVIIAVAVIYITSSGAIKSGFGFLETSVEKPADQLDCTTSSASPEECESIIKEGSGQGSLTSSLGGSKGGG